MSARGCRIKPVATDDRNGRVDAVGSHFLYRAYLNEIVVIQERLQRMIVLLKKGLGLPVFIQQCEIDVVQFFHPLLFEKEILITMGSI